MQSWTFFLAESFWTRTRCLRLNKSCWHKILYRRNNGDKKGVNHYNKKERCFASNLDGLQWTYAGMEKDDGEKCLFLTWLYRLLIFVCFYSFLQEHPIIILKKKNVQHFFSFALPGQTHKLLDTIFLKSRQKRNLTLHGAMSKQIYLIYFHSFGFFVHNCVPVNIN